MTQKAASKTQRIPVRVIQQARGSALVEGQVEGYPQRVIVPVEALDREQTITGDDLLMGIPYGVPWEDLLDNALPSRDEIITDLAGRLRQAGIWDEAALMQNMQAAIGALLAAHGISAAALLKAVIRHREKTGGTNNGK